MRRSGIAAVLLWAAAIGGAALWLTRYVEITTDLSAFLPAAATPAQSLLVAQLREGPASRLILLGVEGADVPALASISRALTSELQSNSRFALVTNGDAARLSRERELVFRWRYLLSPATTPERFSTFGLRAALDDALRLIASPLGPIVKPTLPADPTGEMLRLVPVLAGDAQNRTLRDGVAFSADGRRALMVAQTRDGGFDLDAQQAAAEAIRTAFARIAPSIAGDTATLVMSGPGLLAVASRAQIQQDVQRTSLLTLAGVALLLWVTYRSAWPMLLSAVPALSGLALGVVAVSLVFGPVHAITLGFGAMLIGEAIDYPTYLFANNASNESLQATQSRIGSTLALAVATTACGALAMLLSGFRGLAQLGLLILAGVVVAGLVTRFVLPALTPVHALARKRPTLPFDASRALAPLRRNAWLAFAAIAFAAGILIFERDALWDDDLANLNPLHGGERALDRELRGQTGAPDLRYLAVANGSDRESALAASEAIAARLERAVEGGALTGYDFAARYLPSEATQRSRRAALPQASVLQQNLASALADLPFREDGFAPFAADVERTRSGPLLVFEDLRGTALALKVESLLQQHESRWIALLPLSGVSDPVAVRDALGDAPLFDLKAEADQLVAGYRAQSLRSTAIGLACIVIVVYAGVRSIRAAVGVLVPVLGAVLLTAAALVAAGEKLSIFHLVSLLLVVGVGLNYALFFGRGHATPAERDLTLLSVAVAGVATLIAASALATAGTPVLNAIGLTTGLGAVFAFAVSAAFSSDDR